jgi:multidrug efflux pump subunit AcrA (membrane-fusion protein)
LLARIEGKIAIIKDLLRRTRAEIQRLAVEDNSTALQSQLDLVQARFDRLTAELEAALQALAALEGRMECDCTSTVSKKCPSKTLKETKR